jgi:hypothetical protein
MEHLRVFVGLAILNLIVSCAPSPEDLPQVTSPGTISRDDLAGVWEAVVRVSVQGEDPNYFLAHCISISPYSVPAGRSREDRIKSVWDAAAPDPETSFFGRLRDLPNHFRPGSACTMTEGDYDIVERETGRRPALRVVLGAVEMISPDHVVVLEFTTAGWLTETVFEYEVQRSSPGEWTVVHREILLQV